ncbi:MAG: hypothetical protein JXB48_10165 [Candidatus Latescibacteria bacterium]|nr:hypothetical protein [Candidatus Latescibacterota bacterium]
MKSQIIRIFFVIHGIIAVLLPVIVSAEETPNYTSRIFPDPNGKLIYIPDDLGNTIPDFSHAGYEGGGVALPYVPVKETLWPVAGDNAPLIQAAIDRVSSMPPDADGFRGAVLLKQGYYKLESQLHISASGVVLRGEGQGDTGTILFGYGVFDSPDNRTTANLIVVGGKSCWDEQSGSAQPITDDYVPVGANIFQIKDAKGFRVGDTVLVVRHGNQDWIDELGMNLENKEWRWDPFSIKFDRIITGIEGNIVTIDAPIVCAIENRWGGGELVKYTDKERISQVGIENLRGLSDFDVSVRTKEYGNIDRQPYIGEEYYSDEKHYWNFIAIDNTKNAWIRNVTGLHFAYSLIGVGEGTKWITVQDCSSLEPVSGRWGGKRFTYLIQGQLILIQRCSSDKGRHSFVLSGPQACGPNVFLDCSVTVPYSSSEPHYKFVTGALYDNVIAPLTARFWQKIVIGWAGANCVFWNCEGQYLIQKPPAAQNYAFGHIGIHATVFNTYFQDLTKENGYIESWDRHVDPQSLYLEQLKNRLGEDAVKNIGYGNNSMKNR